MSLREAARRVGVSVDRLKRAERGDRNVLTIDLAARIAPVVGLQLAASLHLNGDPVRDRAHIALLERFRSRLHPSLSWRTEVPMPIAGDLRAADGLIEGGLGTILVEAEARLTDLQAVERKSILKKRDLGADRLILLIAETPNNRKVLALHRNFANAFQSAPAHASPRWLAGRTLVAIAWSSSEPIRPGPCGSLSPAADGEVA